MTTLNGLVGIVYIFPVIVAYTSLSSQRVVLIHQFHDRHGFPRPAVLTVPISIMSRSGKRD
jgi:hypothetical protein